ncbi:MAG: sigma 54-interacting transcriptional regulator [Myxococcota bacterium]
MKPEDKAPQTSTWEAKGFPSVIDLLGQLRVREGMIDLAGERLFLLHYRAFGALRRELIETIGRESTRGVLVRVGYLAGSSDAQVARRLRPGGSVKDAFIIGPQLHALTGMVKIEAVRLEVDVEHGSFYGEFIWHESAEAEMHVQDFGIGHAPACWMQTGYACGFASAFMGQPILWREVQCKAKGDPVCRMIGKPVNEWENISDELRDFQPEDFVNRVQEATSSARRSRPASIPPPSGENVVGVSSAFSSVSHKVRQAAETDVSVLFLGETGVGKERFARLLHDVSRRAQGPFVAVNCAAIPEELVEAELFGVEKGAFTGALQSRAGKFERAEGGTIFLDEVGLLSLSAQAKLLRVLQEREIERVGGQRPQKIDIRVLAATNVELEAEVAARRFRADLYYRIGVFPIQIPPLRDRRADIPLLCSHFLHKYAAQHQKNVTGISERALRLLLDYEFAGNVRELENMIERGVILVRSGHPIDIEHLMMPSVRFEHFEVGADGRLHRVTQDDEWVEESVDDLVDGMLQSALSYDELEQRVLARAVERAKGNLSAAARSLGMTRRQLSYRLHEKKND